ncbi:MAG TPA: zinc ribbon domain-containing protein, partial [Candidatus Wallbacteria bacterium]|nr:zinc ribbon domain-containing protein [Candidatus Wallbacteria bacterium]
MMENNVNFVCLKCSNINPENSIFCNKCGNKLIVEKKVCNKCLTENPENSNFCNKCGNNLTIVEGNVKTINMLEDF